MGDLIDRDTVIESILAFERLSREPDDYYYGALEDAVSLIRKAPSVDAEPVKRGKWKSYLIPHWTKRYDDNGEPEYKYHAEYVCNICEYNSIIKHNYCPHCGAKNVEDAK